VRELEGKGGVGGKGRGWGEGGEMTQILYAHMNKRYIFSKKEENNITG
jgi:hypothetical protein